MENKKAALLLNGDYKEKNFYKNVLKNYDFIVCADGAGNILYELKILPDILLGDLDSITDEALEYFKKNNVSTEVFPTEKNYTDSQLGLERLMNLGYVDVDIYGGFGNRADHGLGNIGLIYWGHKKGLKVRLIDENNQLEGLRTGKTAIIPRQNSIFSVIAIFEDLEALSIINAKYPLDRFYLEKGEPRGISNEFLDGEVILTLEKGFGLLCVANKI